MLPKLTQIREEAEQKAVAAERKTIDQALIAHNGNLQAVAAELQCSRGYLYRAIAKHGINLESYRPERAQSKTKKPRPRKLNENGQPNLLVEAVDDFERRFIERHLRKHGGSVRTAALALGTSRGGLYKRMERLGIKYEGFR